MVPLMQGYLLILYLAVQETSMGCMLGQLAGPNQKERVIYCLSKKFTSCEINYIAIEKACYALAWASCKLWQYMLYYTMRLISRMDPIKYIFEKPTLTGKISCWQMLLSICDEKGHLGPGNSRLPSGLATKWSRTFRIPLPWWGCHGTRARTIQCETMALVALFWWYRKWSRSNLSFP